MFSLFKLLVAMALLGCHGLSAQNLSEQPKPFWPTHFYSNDDIKVFN